MEAPAVGGAGASKARVRDGSIIELKTNYRN